MAAVAEQKSPPGLSVRGKPLNVKGKYRNPMIFKESSWFVLVHHFEGGAYEVTMVNGLDPQQGWRAESGSTSIVPLQSVHDALNGKPGFAAAVRVQEPDGHERKAPPECNLIVEEKLAGRDRIRTYKIPCSRLDPMESLSSHGAFMGELVMTLEGYIAKNIATPKAQRRKRRPRKRPSDQKQLAPPQLTAP